MRFEVSKLSEKLKIKLIHCDMFPYPNEYTIDFGLAEETAILAASGIALYEPVFVYGACNFILGKYHIMKTLTQIKHPIIFFNAGGSNNPCYADFGKGHQFNEDLQYLKLLGYNVYTPNSPGEIAPLTELILGTKDPHPKVVRLGRE